MKKIFVKTFMASLPFTSLILLSSCSNIEDTKNTIHNSVSLEKFNSIKVNDNKFIKGADVSSIAEMYEEFLWENKIFKTNMDGSISNYSYKELYSETIKDKNSNKNITLMEYLNNNMFSYINEKSEKVYSNYFHILKNEVGINSIRLRVFVDPYNENKESYGGGHNDLDTTIWIMKEAIKYGINDFNIDFHFSDFWADPNRQWTPKSWTNLNTEELKQKIKDYTYSTLKTIYNETNTIPKNIQLGNEITKGFMWKQNPNDKYNSGKNNINISSEYLEYAIQGVNTFEKEIGKNNYINIGLHLDDATGENPKKNFSTYLSNKFINDNVDILYLTYYPMWQKHLDIFYNDLVNFYSNFNKKIVIAEYSHPWTSTESYLSFNNVNNWSMNYLASSVNGQSFMFYNMMETLSKALPNMETGFYYWEPSWLQVGRTGWATDSGIKYAENVDNFDTNKINEGNAWWDQAFFDNTLTLLPSAKIVKNYSRIKDGNILFEVQNKITEDVLKQDPNFYSDLNVINSNIASNNNMIIYNGFYKTDIKSELIDFYNKKINYKIEIYENEIDSISEENILSRIKKVYSRLNWSEVYINNYMFDETKKSGSFDIIAKPNSYLYYGQQKIEFSIKKFVSNSIDLSNNPILISRNDTNWSSKVIELLNKQNNFSNLVWEYLNITGGISISENKIWLYNNDYKINRDAEWIILKEDKVYRENSNIANFYKINENKISFPTNLGSLTNEKNLTFYFAIRIQINSYIKTDTWEQKSDFRKYGTENWVNFPLLSFKINFTFND